MKEMIIKYTTEKEQIHTDMGKRITTKIIKRFSISKETMVNGMIEILFWDSLVLCAITFEELRDFISKDLKDITFTFR